MTRDATDSITAVCEWKYDKMKMKFITNCGGLYGVVYPTKPDWFKYCPYCGKPIKVIE